ncbi:39S ribosomal protein L4, mitochondrial-like [Melanotaenia boesemani]|uniref:39S ribosomal protein L4, mitochondrial-like n=1 Tax=Melanotaenia boesemani TaxID=1250792 RepID=UPI001C05BDEF|nr:39S ribosomal protein L4, mitochondrial-like [Melanotaenia boesemani]
MTNFPDHTKLQTPYSHRRHGSTTTCYLSLRVAKRFSSSFSGEKTLPPNLLLPSNLIDPERLKRSPPPADCSLPLLRWCDAVVPAHLRPVQTWVDTLGRKDSEPLGLAQLHPDVFAVQPRLDVLHSVEIWRPLAKSVRTCQMSSLRFFSVGGM